MKQAKFVTTALAAAIAGLAFASTAANAAIINSAFIPGQNTIQDTDAERILDSTGTVKTSGSFAVGDVIESVLRFDTVNSANINQKLGMLNYDLMAYSQLRIDAINFVSNGLDGINGTFDDVYQFTFGATGNLGADVLVAIYESTTSPSVFDLTTPPATGISNVTGSTLVAELGLNGTDDFWTSNSILSIVDLATGAGQNASGVFGISLLSNAGGLPIVTNGIISPVDGNMHDVVGDASIYPRETNVNDGWLYSSNLNASFNVVPEPASLALMGLGLLGMGVSLRKRKAA